MAGLELNEDQIGDLQNDPLQGLVHFLKHNQNHPNFHQWTLEEVLRFFQDLREDTENQAWETLRQFVLDETLSFSGRKNAVWIALGLLGQLHDDLMHQRFINDCIYMLLKTMTTGVQLDQVSLNESFYENLGPDSAAKQPGIGLFEILRLYLTELWPICCRQLERLLVEEEGFKRTVKILIGLFDFRHCEGFEPEYTQECDDLVASIIARDVMRADNSDELGDHVHFIKEEYTRYNDDEGYCE